MATSIAILEQQQGELERRHRESSKRILDLELELRRLESDRRMRSMYIKYWVSLLLIHVGFGLWMFLFVR